MAKIPTLNDSPRASIVNVPRTPTLSPREASAGSRQAAQLSGQLADGLGRLYKQQQAEADKVSFTKAQIEFSKLSNDELIGLDKDFNGSNYENYASEGLQRLQARKDQILESAPDRIKEQLSLDLESKMARFDQKLKSRELSNKSQYAVFETQDQIKSAAQSSYSGWDPLQNFENSQRLKNVINASKQYDEKTKRALNDKVSTVSRDMVNGVIDRGNMGEMNEALNDLKDESQADIFSSLNPKDKTKAISRLENKIEAERNKAKVKTNKDHRKVLNSLQGGTLNVRDPKDREVIERHKNKIMTTYSPEEAKDYMSDITVYEKANEKFSEDAIGGLISDPSKESVALFSEESDPLFQAAGEAKAKKVLSALQANRIQEFKKSPADYLVKYDSNIANQALESNSDGGDLSEMIVSMDAAYDKLGVSGSNRQYLPTQLKNRYGAAQALMEEKNYAAASQVLEDFKQKAGDDAFRLYDELDIDKNVASTLLIEDPDTRATVLADLANLKDTIDPVFKQKANESNADIDSKLIKDDFYKAMISVNPEKGMSSLKNAQPILNIARTQYKKAIIKGVGVGDAQEQAFNAIKKSYDILDNGAYPIPIRKREGINSDKLQKFVSYINEDDSMPYKYLKNLKPIKASNGVELTQEEMNNTVINSGKWVYDSKEDGLKLLKIGDNGKLSEFRDKDNKPYIVKLEDAQNMWDDINAENMEIEEKVRRQNFLKRNFASKSPYGLMR